MPHSRNLRPHWAAAGQKTFAITRYCRHSIPHKCRAQVAKRDGAVTLAELGADRAWALITGSLGWPAADMAELLDRFDPAALPREPWIYRG